MLVLSRRPGEKLLIGRDISLTLVEVQGGRVKIGIEAPPHISILRAELADSLETLGQATGNPNPRSV